jgi:hypothetical protein
MHKKIKLFESKGIDNNKYKELKFKVPNKPYKSEQPNKKIPEIKEPDTKYLKLASVPKDEFLLNEAKT